MKRWRVAQMRLVVIGLIFVFLAFERLANAAMLREPASVSAALRVSYGFGIAGAMTFIVLLLVPIVASIRSGTGR